MSDFFAMGGYALYVWSAYGLVFLVLTVLLALSVRAMRQRERMLEALETDRPRRASR